MKLGTLLLRDGVINLDQLEAALRAQVLFGGKLGTNLVELGHLDLDTLASYLGRALGAPVASEEDLAGARPDALRIFSATLAAKHQALPLRFTGEGKARTLVVAVADPHAAPALAELEAAAQSALELHVAPEMRIQRYLARHYGVAQRSRPRPGRVADVAPATMTIEPMTSAPEPWPLASALRDLEQAETREQVAAVLLHFCRGRVDLAVLFRLDAEARMAVGWKGFGPGIDAATLGTLEVALDTPSALSAILVSRAPVRRAPQGAGDLEIVRALGAYRPPDELLAVPLLIGGKAELVLWAHARALVPFDDNLADALVSLLNSRST